MNNDGPNDEDEECGWCGEEHGLRCPYVAAMEYDNKGKMRRVEFFPVFEQVVEGNISRTTISGGKLN
jgi:hypothetical protein